MGRLPFVLGFLAATGPGVARAQLQEVRLTIFGMD